MTIDDAHTKLRLLLEKQPQFAANSKRMEEASVNDSDRDAKVEESFARLVQLAKKQDKRTMSPRVQFFIEEYRKVVRGRSKEADKRLNSLIRLVERCIARKRK